MSLSYNELLRLNWRKAKRSMSNGNCVEVASLAGSVTIRDSKDPHGIILNYSAGPWESFTQDARTGKFDVFHG
jgi:hypothetical protein